MFSSQRANHKTFIDGIQSVVGVGFLHAEGLNKRIRVYWKSCWAASSSKSTVRRVCPSSHAVAVFLLVCSVYSADRWRVPSSPCISCQTSKFKKPQDSTQETTASLRKPPSQPPSYPLIASKKRGRFALRLSSISPSSVKLWLPARNFILWHRWLIDLAWAIIRKQASKRHFWVKARKTFGVYWCVYNIGRRSPCGKNCWCRMFNCYRIKKHCFCQQFWEHFLKIVRYFGFYNLRFTGYHESESACFHHRFRCGCEIWLRSHH